MTLRRTASITEHRNETPIARTTNTIRIGTEPGPLAAAPPCWRRAAKGGSTRKRGDIGVGEAEKGTRPHACKVRAPPADSLTRESGGGVIRSRPDSRWGGWTSLRARAAPLPSPRTQPGSTRSPGASGPATETVCDARGRTLSGPPAVERDLVLLAMGGLAGDRRGPDPTVVGRAGPRPGPQPTWSRSASASAASDWRRALWASPSARARKRRAASAAWRRASAGRPAFGASGAP